jgi:hypothetical protein
MLLAGVVIGVLSRLDLHSAISLYVFAFIEIFHPRRPGAIADACWPGARRARKAQ